MVYQEGQDGTVSLTITRQVSMQLAFRFKSSMLIFKMVVMTALLHFQLERFSYFKFTIYIKNCLWKLRTQYRLENGSLGFIETLHEQNSIFKDIKTGPMIPKEIKYNLHYGEVGKTFHRRHTALILAAV